jgi:hypothetical protein
MDQDERHDHDADHDHDSLPGPPGQVTGHLVKYQVWKSRLSENGLVGAYPPRLLL